KPHPFGVPLAFLAAALSMPAVARAGCEYPTHIKRMTAGNALSRTSLGTIPQPTSTLPGKPCPCSGPTCSPCPVVPDPPASPSHVKLQEWGCLLLSPFLDLFPLTSSCRDAESQQPVRRLSSIFHPPRSLARSTSA